MRCARRPLKLPPLPRQTPARALLWSWVSATATPQGPRGPKPGATGPRAGPSPWAVGPWCVCVCVCVCMREVVAVWLGAAHTVRLPERPRRPVEDTGRHTGGHGSGGAAAPQGPRVKGGASQPFLARPAAGFDRMAVPPSRSAALTSPLLERAENSGLVPSSVCRSRVPPTYIDHAFSLSVSLSLSLSFSLCLSDSHHPEQRHCPVKRQHQRNWGGGGPTGHHHVLLLHRPHLRGKGDFGRHNCRRVVQHRGTPGQIRQKRSLPFTPPKWGARTRAARENDFAANAKTALPDRHFIYFTTRQAPPAPACVSTRWSRWKRTSRRMRFQCPRRRTATCWPRAAVGASPARLGTLCAGFAAGGRGACVRAGAHAGQRLRACVVCSGCACAFANLFRVAAWSDWRQLGRQDCCA